MSCKKNTCLYTAGSDSVKIPLHVRERAKPRSSDIDYLVLSDLNDFMRVNGTSDALTLLDYGAGSSPYRLYFPNSDYRTADITGAPHLGYRIGPDSMIAEIDATFDLIISTQVLEHVSNYNDYLKECFRLLKKGGSLLLTTHGVFEEHGVPQDFQRWTEEGMLRDLKTAGFKDITMYKLTCGFRAALFIFIREFLSRKNPPSQLPRFLFRSLRFILRRVFWVLNRICDWCWPDQRIIRVGESKYNPSLYIIIAVIVKK